MKNDMTSLLNLAYEIEGLLLLHINRGEEAAPEMSELLARKVSDLLDGVKVCSDKSVSISEISSSIAEPCTEPVITSEAEQVADSTLIEEIEDAGEMSSITLDEKLARDRASDISKAFTLNDKFRFCRDLFRNSDLEFKETLEVIGGMSGMDEAEDYFYNDLCWDPENEEVKEFMSIVAKHF